MTGKAFGAFDYCSLGSLQSTMFADVGTGRTGIIAGGRIIPLFAHDLFIATPYYRGDLLGWAAAGIDGRAMFRGAGVPADGAFAVSLYSGGHPAAGALVASSGPSQAAVVGPSPSRSRPTGTGRSGPRCWPGRPGWSRRGRCHWSCWSPASSSF